MTRQEAEEKYGRIVNGVWPDEEKHCQIIVIENEIAKNWINTITGKPVTRLYLNRDMISPLRNALNNVMYRGLQEELKTFDGIYMARSVRGRPDLISSHAHAMAIDINAKQNPLGGPIMMTREFAMCFIDAGFVWGAEFDRIDGMHFSMLGY